QAEDGIRDDLVTGVQTCALPIWSAASSGRWPGRPCPSCWKREWELCERLRGSPLRVSSSPGRRPRGGPLRLGGAPPRPRRADLRSEERRVGKECRYRGGRRVESE